MTDSPIDRDLAGMAGNPRLAEAVKQSLESLRDGTAGPAMADMADEILNGRTDLRSVARSSAYASQLTEGIEKFSRWYADLSPEDREELGRRTQEMFDYPDNRGAGTHPDSEAPPPFASGGP